MSLAYEIYRKTLHFLMVLLPMAFFYYGKWRFLLIVAPITVIILFVDFLRQKDPKVNNLFVKIFGIFLREHERDGQKLCGATWLFLGVCINFLIFKPAIATTGFLILVIADGLAPLVGKSIQSEKFFEKTILGSTTFFVSAMAVLIGCGIHFDMKFWFYIFGIFAVFCVTIIEARPSFLNVDDNFSIPIVFGVVMTFFDLMWNYSY